MWRMREGVRGLPGRGNESSARGWFFPRHLPRLGKFPVNIERVVDVLQQSRAAIEKTEPENVVIEEGGGGIEERVPREPEP